MKSLISALPEVFELYLLIVLGAAVPLLLFIFLRQRYFSPLSRVPGPFSGSFGTFFKCWHTVKGDYPVALTQLHRKLGSLVRISYNEVSVGDAEGIRLLNSDMDKGPQYECFAIPSPSYQNTMSERDQKETVRMRQNVAAGYTQSNLLRSESYMDDLLVLMEQRIEQDSNGGTRPVELGKWIHFWTMDLVGDLSTSAPFGFLKEGKDIGMSVANTSRASFYISFMGSCMWLHWFLLGSPVLKLVNCEKIPFVHMWTTVLRGVAKRKENPEARYDMMEHWMAQQRKDPERMPEAELLTAMLANLGAGGDTAGSTIQAFFYYILRNDSYYFEKLRQELSAAGHQAGCSTPVGFLESQQLPFLQACIRETLRLFSPVPWTLQRTVPAEGFRACGQHFPAGTILSASPYVIHHNRDIWGADADEFKPERWLQNQERTREMEKHFIPFGAGYNRCIGHNLAAMELGKATATLLRDFDLQLVHPDREWKLAYRFIMNPHGWPVRVSRRKQA